MSDLSLVIVISIFLQMDHIHQVLSKRDSTRAYQASYSKTRALCESIPFFSSLKQNLANLIDIFFLLIQVAGDPQVEL